MPIATTTRPPQPVTPAAERSRGGVWATVFAYLFAVVVVGLWMASALHNPYVFVSGILLIPVLIVCEFGMVEWISYQKGRARVWGIVGGIGALLAYAALCLVNVV